MKFLNSVLDNSKTNSENISWSSSDFEDRATELELNEIEENDPDLFERLTVNETHLVIPQEHKRYDRTKFKSALSEMLNKADSTIGVTWTTVDFYLDELCKLKSPEDSKL